MNQQEYIVITKGSETLMIYRVFASSEEEALKMLRNLPRFQNISPEESILFCEAVGNKTGFVGYVENFATEES